MAIPTIPSIATEVRSCSAGRFARFGTSSSPASAGPWLPAVCRPRSKSRSARQRAALRLHNRWC